ncbi:MAG: hypothetical protein ACRDO7_01450 [Nocardioidaceae bacterium]
MSTTTSVPAAFRLGRRTRRAVLVTHIISASAWIGIDVVVAILVVTSMTTDSVQTQAVAYQALGIVAVWPMFVAGLASLVTGLVLGLGTTYGLVRFWWVAAKLCLNIVLTTLILVALRPGVDELAEYGRVTLGGGSPDGVDTGQLLFPPSVSLTALTVAVVLSVYKPWGRIRRP